MSSPSQFKHYLICQDVAGKNIEIVRSGDQVVVLAFDSQRLQFVHCHVLMEPLADRGAFEKRASLLKKSGHPLLARVLDFGEDEGSPYYITANTDGETLRELISRHEELPGWLAMQLTTLAIGAVRVLHERGDFLSGQPLSDLRALFTGPTQLQVCVADYRLREDGSVKKISRRKQEAALAMQSKALLDYMEEKIRLGGVAEAMLPASEFGARLDALLVSIAPGLGAALDELQSALASLQPPVPSGDLVATYKPKPLIVPLLASFQEVARCVAQSVRMQSQRLDPSQPYALSGTLMKTGQHIFVEQVPPFRLVGAAPSGALLQVVHSPKSGKLPNLLPVVFVEEKDGIECFAETVVEGLNLRELLDERGALDAQEIYLVLAAVDSSLAQFEKAGRTSRRLRLDDIYLFTGYGQENPRDAGLMGRKLGEWPGFSIVLRGHHCLHSLVGRGTDPAVLLPLEPVNLSGVESLWNGGWMAALATCLLGSGDKVKNSDAEESVAQLLNDELALAQRGSPSSRAGFLGRYARVLRYEDMEEISGGGLWTEVGATSIAPSPVAEMPRMEVTDFPALMVSTEEPEPAIGFAEALMQPFTDDQMDEPDESSWMEFRNKRPLWIKALLLIIVAAIAAAGLAHYQGRAWWQKRASAKNERGRPLIDPLEMPKGEALEKSATPLLPPPNDPPAPVIDKLTVRLREIRQSGAKFPDELRASTEKAAQSGNTEAMIALGTLLLRADSGNVDEPAAFGWFDRAFMAGDKSAMLPLASCYLQGWGTKPDFSQAVNLLKKALGNGENAAGDLLGVCYLGGLGVTRDEAKAHQLFTEARDAGVASACGNLGNMYLKGLGVTADAARAVTLFAEGARKGHAESMLFYAQCLENGTGTRADLGQATIWYQKAARAGNAEAAGWCRARGLAF